MRMVSGDTLHYTYDAWGNVLSLSGILAELNPFRYRSYYYDNETWFYYLQSRYYDPAIGRFINADAFYSTGQGVLGYNMFAYCNNSPIIFKDPSGTRLIINDPASDFEYLRDNKKDEEIHFTASIGGVVAFGIGPLAASVQFSIVSDSLGNSELQISYTAPNIFDSRFPSVDEMLAADSNWRFNVAVAGTVSLTNATSVYDLYGPSYSIGGSMSGVAVDYNIIPKAGDSSQAYSGITLSGGLITPGFNIGMNNTVYGISLPFTVFELADAAYKGWLGVQ